MRLLVVLTTCLCAHPARADDAATGLGGAWYAVRDVPLGAGGVERLRLPPGRYAALRLWFTQPASSPGVGLREVAALGADNETIPATKAVARSWQRLHGPDRAIDGRRDTYWACDWTPGVVPWLEIHFEGSVAARSLSLRWGDNFASMYRVDAQGPCRPTAAMRARGLSCASPAAPRRRPYEVLVRTTAANLMQTGYVANIQRLRGQLRARLTLLVDLTICGGLACDVDWLAKDLGVDVFGYTARDLASRWPKVRWADGLALRSLLANTRWALGWLVRRMDRTLFRASRISWPWRDDAVRNITVQARDVTTMMIPWLVHEPSVILWRLRRRADSASAPRRAKSSDGADLWVLEDDEVFAGNASAFFDHFARAVRADYVSTFQPHPGADCLYREATTAALGAGRAQLDKPCVPPAESPRDSHAGDSRPLWPVHKWEHIERFSPQLLAALDDVLARGAAAHGEVFASSVCDLLSWCTSFDLRESGSVDSRGERRGDWKEDSSATLSEGLWHHVDIPIKARFQDGQKLSASVSTMVITKAQLDSTVAWMARGFHALTNRPTFTRSENKLAFVNIPKNAGASIAQTVKYHYMPINVCDLPASARCVGEKVAIVVLRNPFDRFASAVRYAIKERANLPHVKRLLKQGLTTPDDWARALASPGSVECGLVESEMLNRDVRGVRTTTLQWKGMYAPQSSWVYGLRRPPIVLRFGRLEEDWNALVLGPHEFGHAPLPVRATAKGEKVRSKSVAPAFSKTSCDLLGRVYENDVQLIEATLHETHVCRLNAATLHS